MMIYMDLMSKAKAYGGAGHHSVFDINNPWTLSRFSNQIATNMVNLNNMMQNTPIEK